MRLPFQPKPIRLAICLALPALLFALAASAQESDEITGPTTRIASKQVQITKAIKVGSLDSLRDVVLHREAFGTGQHEVDLGTRPLPKPATGARMDAHTAQVLSSRIEQTKAVASPLGVTAGTSVDGLGTTFVGPNGAFSVNVAPPDTVGAVGATQFVQVVNSALAVFDKTTKQAVLGALPTNALWQGFGGICEADNNGDGTVVYDKGAHRWIVSQFALQGGKAQCVAVSKTSDATGGWWLYEFDTPATETNDYPKMGVWPDGYYETFNLFGAAGFDGALVCAYDRISMLAGKPATQQCFTLPDDYSMLPGDLDGTRKPPAGAPDYLAELDFNTLAALGVRTFHVDWANPSNSVVSDPVFVPVAPFNIPCNAARHCITQQSQPLNKVDSLGDRMMYRLVYRNFGDHQSLVASHSIPAGNGLYTGVRWYEMRPTANGISLYQQSTYAPDRLNRWMPSVAMDKLGDIAVGYSASGYTSDPSVRYAVRLASDPLNTLQAETTMHQGSGAQGPFLNRWGDYSALTVDPTDDCTFWYTQEYNPVDGQFNWATRIGSFKLPTCQ